MSTDYYENNSGARDKWPGLETKEISYIIKVDVNIILNKLSFLLGLCVTAMKQAYK